MAIGGQGVVRNIFVIGFVMALFLIGIEIASYYEKIDYELKEDIVQKLDPIVSAVFSSVAILLIIVSKNFSFLIIYLITPIFVYTILYILDSFMVISDNTYFKGIERIKLYYQLLGVISIIGFIYNFLFM